MRRFTTAVLASICTIAVATMAGIAQAQCSGNWVVGSGTPGLLGPTSGNAASIYAMLTWDPDGAGPRPEELVVGGRIHNTFGVIADGVASWDGQNWHALGSGLNAGGAEALTVWQGKLIAGGYFTIAGGVPAHFVAAWDGSTWSAMGAGIGGGFGVSSLGTANGQLFASSFTTVYRWDGANWQSIGSPLPNSVNVLIEYQGKLVAGGVVPSPGTPSASGVAQWDGNSWHPLGSSHLPTSVNITAMAVYDDNLVVAGYFTAIGGVAAKNIAAWNGASWQPLGSGISQSTLTVASYHGDLWVGGATSRWNSVQGWRSVTPFAPYSRAMAVFKGELAVGGYGGAPGETSYGAFARWSELSVCSADFDCSGSVGVTDIWAFLGAWFAADSRADFNNVNGINIRDIFDFLVAWFAGC